MTASKLFLTMVLFSGMAFGCGLLGCGDDKPSTENSDGPVCVDVDGDGYGGSTSTACTFAELDCDDSDPEVNPGAVEGPFGHATCSDGLDNDCDGLIDTNDSDCDDVVVLFPDQNLEVLIRIEISKFGVDIMASDLQGLDYFSARLRDISDITGLEHCVNLTQLEIGYNEITDISPLARLVNLTQLGIGFNQITDIDPLAGLVNLTVLRLHENQITDLHPLVLNTGIDTGDSVDVASNPLNATSCAEHIPALQSRGVSVSHDCQ